MNTNFTIDKHILDKIFLFEILISILTRNGIFADIVSFIIFNTTSIQIRMFIFQCFAENIFGGNEICHTVFDRLLKLD